MDIDKLRDYDEWIDKTPEQILTAVKQVNGWGVVFPGTLPLFAHQVRNFFNVEPTSLTLYARNDGNQYSKEVRKRFEDWGFVDKAKGILALSGDVYWDQSNRTWFQMSAGGTIYHWGGEPTWDIVDATFSNYVRKQDGVPVFKLISPDGTGGSAETIIRNRSRFTIGVPNELVQVTDRVVRDYHDQGSYNYSETVEVGLPTHEKHDVAPHRKYPKYYLNPPNRFLPLNARRFPPRKLRDGRQIGYEKGMEPFEFDTRRGYDGPQGPMTVTDPFAEEMAQSYPPNRSSERVTKLENLFRLTGKPKRLLARIEARKDKAARDFHTPTIIRPDTARRLLKILKDRPQGGPKDIGI